MKAGFSLWISNDDDKKIFGLGPYKLLLLIDELGSLNKAAKEMKISYSKALDILNKAEIELGIKLLDKEVGGIDGGGSALTEDGMKIVAKYEKYRKTADLAIKEIFEKIFN